jgi:hypothetical protein
MPAAGTVNSARVFNDGTEQDVAIFKQMETIDASVASIPEVQKYKETITRLINPDGSINRSPENTPIQSGSQGSGDPAAIVGNTQQQGQQATAAQQQVQGAAAAGLFAQGQPGNVHNAPVGTNVSVELHPSEALIEGMTRAVREGIRTQGETTSAGTVHMPDGGQHNVPQAPAAPEPPHIIRPGDPDFHNPSSSNLPDRMMYSYGSI